MTFKLKPGIISENRDQMNILGDFIAWMDNHEGLFDAMSAWSLKHGMSWGTDDYYVSCDLGESDGPDFACAIFDAMRDLSQFMPDGYMFGWTEEKFGIFECRITIEVIEEVKPKYDEQTLETLKMISLIMEQMALLAESMARLSGAAILRLGPQMSDADKFFLHAARELSQMVTANGSSVDFIHRRLMGEINHRVNMNNRSKG
jgi:hypothetical protein